MLHKRRIARVSSSTTLGGGGGSWRRWMLGGRGHPTPLPRTDSTHHHDALTDHEPARCVPAPPPMVDEDIDCGMLMSGEEALRRLAMLQISLQFMLWQQNRPRWEGIVMSAMAYMEGIHDVRAALQPHPMEGSASTSAGSRSGATQHDAPCDHFDDGVASSPQRSRSGKDRLAAYVDNMGRTAFLGESTVVPAAGRQTPPHDAASMGGALLAHHRYQGLILSLPTRSLVAAPPDVAEARPPLMVLPTASRHLQCMALLHVDAALAPRAVGTPPPRLPSAEGTPQTLLPLPPPPPAAAHVVVDATPLAHDAPQAMAPPIVAADASARTRQEAVTSPPTTADATALLRHESPQRVAKGRAAHMHRDQALLSEQEALFIGIQRLDVLCGTFDALLTSGLPLRRVFAEAVVDSLLARSGGYVALSRRQRLLACEFGLSAHIARSKGQWRRQQERRQWCHGGDDVALRSGGPVSQRALLMGIERAVTWPDALTSWRRLMHHFPQVATDGRTLRRLQHRFGLKAMTGDAAVRAAMRDAKIWPTDQDAARTGIMEQAVAGTDNTVPVKKGTKRISKLQRSLRLQQEVSRV